ncbi:MAG: hypothetical protein CML68_03675 [Rhodobacteraceae bacterium]|nr:hypothetical protein [Paracoccaceae bacterium]
MTLNANPSGRRKALLLAATLTVTGLITMSHPAASSESRVLAWENLVPAAPEIDNPFDRLSRDQLDHLGIVARTRDVTAMGKSSAELQDRADEAKRVLEAQGLDIDALLTQREEIIASRMAAAEAVNETLDGASIRMPGYVLPLSFDGEKATEFLLVPYVGACIHVPPPPANQIVHVTFDKGFEVQGLYTPVWVEGAMSVGLGEHALSLVDGTGDIPVGYNLEAVIVEPYKE